MYSILIRHDNAENILVLETDDKGLIFQNFLDNFFHLFISPKYLKFIVILQNILILVIVCACTGMCTYSGNFWLILKGVKKRSQVTKFPQKHSNSLRNYDFYCNYNPAVYASVPNLLHCKNT